MRHFFPGLALLLAALCLPAGQVVAQNHESPNAGPFRALSEGADTSLLGVMALVVDRGAIRCPLGLPADGLHALLSRS